MAENSSLKDQYREKNEFLQTKFEDLFRESEAIKREVVSIDELKKDRDTRIDALRKEIDDLTAQNESVVKENGALLV